VLLTALGAQLSVCLESEKHLICLIPVVAILADGFSLPKWTLGVCWQVHFQPIYVRIYARLALDKWNFLALFKQKLVGKRMMRSRGLDERPSSIVIVSLPILDHAMQVPRWTEVEVVHPGAVPVEDGYPDGHGSRRVETSLQIGC
jgi:hypothetical protein